jgi:hypothetical protein
MKPTGSNSFKGRRSRSGRSLSEGMDKRLASYAAAASAAGVGSRARAPGAAEVITRTASAVGVGLLLTTGPASARIVYTPAYTRVEGSASNPFPLDLNHDGITDFRLHSYAAFPARVFLLEASSAQPGNAIMGNIQGVLTILGAPALCGVASALPAGHRIGSGSRFAGKGYGLMWRYSYFFGRSSTPPAGGSCGYWYNAQGRFLGFEFTIQGQNHFGWARLNVTSGGGRINRIVTLTGYAYETEPNKPIRAGDTGPIADARVPEMYSAPPTVATLRPATLGLLALGSAGLDIWRKEQEQ